MAAFSVIFAGAFLWNASVSIDRGLDMDRYAFMESMVERGTFTVDDSPMQSVDRIRFRGHFYSGKPPVLNFIGAGVYWALYHGLQWSFRTHSEQVVRVMIGVFVSGPLALLLFMFWRVAS